MKNAKEWSRDWERFNWDQVREKLRTAEQKAYYEGGQVNEADIGISLAELKEYFEWLYDTQPERCCKVILYMQLVQAGVPHEEAQIWVNRPEELKEALEELL